MKAFLAAAAIAVALAVAASWVLEEKFQQTAESAFSTTAVRL
jgi:hypothetical protein